jgi:hypothetical protein
MVIVVMPTFLFHSLLALTRGNRYLTEVLRAFEPIPGYDPVYRTDYRYYGVNTHHCLKKRKKTSNRLTIFDSTYWPLIRVVPTSGDER